MNVITSYSRYVFIFNIFQRKSSEAKKWIVAHTARWGSDQSVAVSLFCTFSYDVKPLPWKEVESRLVEG